MLTSRLSNFDGDLRGNEVCELGNLFRFRYFASNSKVKNQKPWTWQGFDDDENIFFRSKKSLKRFQNYIEHDLTRENWFFLDFNYLIVITIFFNIEYIIKYIRKSFSVLLLANKCFSVRWLWVSFWICLTICLLLIKT